MNHTKEDFKRNNKGSPLTEEAYARLKWEVMENRLSPGHQLLESELTQRLNMSRTPVREALIRLQEEGLVEMLPRRGMRVLPLSPTDMQEIYEVLTCIESEATAILAKRRPKKKELSELIQATEDMESALKNDDLEAWAQADNRYHRELVRLCGNRRLASIANTLMDQAHRVRMFTLRLREKPLQSTKEHRDQVSAFLDGDPDRVRDVYRKHRERAAKELMKILQQYNLHNL
jgi:DNA-binding GntR family transcriptional regulator